MDIKRYVLFVISREPLDIEDLKLEDNGAVEHLISEEVRISTNDRMILIIKKALPEQTLFRKSFFSLGNNISEVIINWLSKVCRSNLYDSIWERRKRKNDEQEKDISNISIIKEDLS